MRNGVCPQETKGLKKLIFVGNGGGAIVNTNSQDSNKFLCQLFFF